MNGALRNFDFVTFITRPRNIIFLALIAVAIVIIVLLIRMNRKREKQADEQQEILDKYAQTYTVLVIDKKKVRIKEADLPQEFKDEVPWYSRRAKVPLVKVKVGPKVMTMIADEDIFELIPVKREIKATVSGLYIMDVRGLRTTLEKKEKKKGFLARMFNPSNSGGGGFGGFGRR